MPKPPIDQLLIQSALEPDLCRRLRESPDEVFSDFDLTEEEKGILRHPDHRLLPLLGKALALQAEATRPAEGATAATATTAAPVTNARAVPDTLLALTVVPCAVREDGQLKGFTYAVWVQPLPPGADPASLPPPADSVLPGQPLEPLHAVIQISAVQSQDAIGNPQLGLWACFRQSTNVLDSPPRESAGGARPPLCPMRGDAERIQAAAAAARSAPPEARYARLADLLRTLHPGARR